jgi:hypothetical protein
MHVYPKLIGGIGNQLFILGAAMKYAERTGRTLIFVEKEHKNPHCPADKSIIELFPNIPFVSKREPCIELSNGIFEYVEHPEVSDEIVCISGYNQHYKLLPENFNEWKDHLPTVPFDGTNTCFLHVRRTDYIGIPHLETDLTLYWKRAIELLDKSIEILILSDDMEWASKNVPLIDISRKWKTYDRQLTALQTLYIMSRCEKGAICANSTLSWWGAWLNKSRFIALPYPWSYTYVDEDLGLYFPEAQKIKIT